MIEIEATAQLAGRFKFRMTKPDGSFRETPWWSNLILDVGLNKIGTVNMLGACQVGTGTTPPTVTDSGLQTYLAGTSTVNASSFSAQGSAPYFGTRVTVFRFNAGVATGNISEVGIAQDLANGQPMWSRALVLDGDGNPTTITVLSDEVLDVYYELRIYPPLTDATQTITVGGVSTDVVVRAAVVTSAESWGRRTGNVAVHLDTAQGYTGAIGAITGAPSGTLIANGLTVTDAAYSNNSLERRMSFVIGLSVAGTIRSAIWYTSYGAYQIGFTPGIVKDNTQTLTITVKINWARKTL